MNRFAVNLEARAFAVHPVTMNMNREPVNPGG